MPTIRLATIDDIEDIVSLRMEFLCELQPHLLEHETEALKLTHRYVADKLPKSELMVWFAEEDGCIVGTGGLVFFHRPPILSYLSDLHAYIISMYTLPEFRGRGIATMLLNHIFEYVKTTPARRITLHASESGKPVYKRLGFIDRGNEMVLTLEEPPNRD